MSVVTVQVGQCGNQLGTALFNVLAAEAEAAPDDAGAATRQVCALHGVCAHAVLTDPAQTFFRPRHGVDTARAVLVDMEPKVRGASARRSC